MIVSFAILKVLLPTSFLAKALMKKWLTLCSPQVLLFSFLLGFCSVGMQLLLTALSASLLGARVLHYGMNLTIFLAALGAGAIFSRKLGTIPILLANQWAIGILLSLSIPCLYSVASHGWPIIPFYYLFVILIGGFFGFQIPQLFHHHFPRARSRKGAIPILAATYFGGFLASLSFALWLYPTWGFFPLAAGFSLLSIASALLVLTPVERSSVRGAITFGLLVLATIQLFTANQLRAHLESHLLTTSRNR